MKWSQFKKKNEDADRGETETGTKILQPDKGPGPAESCQELISDQLNSPEGWILETITKRRSKEQPESLWSLSRVPS